MATGLGICSFLALLLAQVGWLRLDLLAALIVAAGTLFWRLTSGRVVAGISDDGRTPADPPVSSTHAALLLAVLVIVSTVLFTPPYQATLWAGDATVYVASGRKISASGALRSDDPLVQAMPVRAREELFRNRMPRDRTGEFARFPGGISIPDIERGQTAPGFAPLYPVWIALFDQLFGPVGVFFVGPFFGVLGVAGVFFVGRTIQGTATGLLAGLLLACSLPQIWFSKFPLSEIVAQFFVISGLWLLLRYFDTGSALLAADGGLLLGAAFLTRFDLLPILVVALMVFVAYSLRFHESVSIPWVFGATFGASVAYGLWHFAYFPSNYDYYIPSRLRRLPMGDNLVTALDATGPALHVALFIGLAGLLLFAAWLAGRRAARPGGARRFAWVLLAGVGLYALVYASSTRAHWHETIPSLGAYLSWPVVILFVAAFVAISWSAVRDGNLKIGLLLAFLVVALLQYLHNPHETMRHILTMRRFVPIVIPGILLVVAAGIVMFARRWIPSAARGMVSAAGAAVLVLVAAPSLPVVNEPFWSNGIRESEEVASMFPADAVVLVGPELAGTHLQLALTYFHEIDAVLLQKRYPHSTLLQEQILSWLDAGRPVYLVVATRDLHFYAPELELAAPASTTIAVRVLEVTDAPPPRRSIVNEARISAFRVQRREGRADAAIEIGTYADDALFDLHGFYGPESTAPVGGRSFRWSGEEASITVPGARQIVLVVDGGRPPGVEPAMLSIWIDDQPVLVGEPTANQPERLVLENPHPDPSALATIRIRSSSFNPRSMGLSDDRRDLGVRIYRVEFGGGGY